MTCIAWGIRHSRHLNLITCLQLRNIAPTHVILCTCSVPICSYCSIFLLHCHFLLSSVTFVLLHLSPFLQSLFPLSLLPLSFHPSSNQEVENTPLSDPNLTILIINSECEHCLANTNQMEENYHGRRKMCEDISKKLGVRWLRGLSWRELEGAGG